MPRTRIPSVFVVSDGHGDTAQQVINAAALQFEGKKFRLVVERDVRTAGEIDEIVRKAATAKGVIFYTLVGNETRREMRKASAEHLVSTVDVLGPAFRALHDLLHQKPGATPGLLYSVERERIVRMEAIDYTLTHDDGQRTADLSKADVVLVGISRTSKSSTCFLLACASIKAANVPLIPGVPPPSSLLKMSPTKVIGLRVNVNRLMAIRAARAGGLNLTGEDEYLDRQSIAREAGYANRLMDENGWRSFDASFMAIEEIAKEVMRIRGLTGRRPW